MRVCLICEGSYPYVSGGVAGWVQMLCESFGDVEFVIWSIATTREEMSEYKYQLPDNVKEVRTIYLGDDNFQTHYKKVSLKPEETEVLRKLVTNKSNEIDWKKTLEFIKKYKKHLVDILMGENFYNICLEEYNQSGSSEIFRQYLWNFRGMYFPFMDILTGETVKADLYHALSTGYAGILGSCASYIEEKPFVLSEHGIYTREREEDIIRAEWVKGGFKELWIDFFKKISMISYQKADVVTSLFEVNKTLQIELGCPEEKIRLISNGVSVEDYSNLVSHNKLEKGKFNIATILRVVPIKDVKTMLLAFEIVQEQLPEANLAILGGYDESPEYYEECLELINSLKIKNVKFYGRVNVKEYMPDIDLLLLSSISEGQPLAILEGMAAGIPFVSTNVGDCKSLLEGNEGDGLGRAGYIVPVMDSKAMAEAIIYCEKHPKQLKQMGEVGRKRVERYYKKESFLQQYRELYKKLGGGANGGDRI
ncbi:MAG: GT4 family glycosyltransferase PelF [Lachnospiraceae bacterium]|nr:GT4 family glycosyltransferase PelF [Lachnospiraceae bacterium]